MQQFTINLKQQQQNVETWVPYKMEASQSNQANQKSVWVDWLVDAGGSRRTP